MALFWLKTFRRVHPPNNGSFLILQWYKNNAHRLMCVISLSKDAYCVFVILYVQSVHRTCSSVTEDSSN